MNTTESRWVSMNEICKHLGISRDTAIKWISNEDLPAHKIGRLWRFQIQEVDDWVRKKGNEGGKSKNESGNHETSF